MSLDGQLLGKEITSAVDWPRLLHADHVYSTYGWL